MSPIKWVKRFLSEPERPLRLSAVLTLVALALMCWSMAQPTPLPIMIAMSVGQGLGTLAFGLYLFVIWQDLRRGRRARRDSQRAISVEEKKPES